MEVGKQVKILLQEGITEESNSPWNSPILLVPKKLDASGQQKFRLVVDYRRPPLWSSGQSFWLQIQRSRVRFPALPDFLSSSGSGTGSTQPREVN